MCQHQEILWVTTLLKYLGSVKIFFLLLFLLVSLLLQRCVFAHSLLYSIIRLRYLGYVSFLFSETHTLQILLYPSLLTVLLLKDKMGFSTLHGIRRSYGHLETFRTYSTILVNKYIIFWQDMFACYNKIP